MFEIHLKDGFCTIKQSVWKDSQFACSKMEKIIFNIRLSINYLVQHLLTHSWATSKFWCDQFHWRPRKCFRFTPHQHWREKETHNTSLGPPSLSNLPWPFCNEDRIPPGQEIDCEPWTMQILTSAMSPCSYFNQKYPALSVTVSAQIMPWNHPPPLATNSLSTNWSNW